MEAGSHQGWRANGGLGCCLPACLSVCPSTGSHRDWGMEGAPRQSPGPNPHHFLLSDNGPQGFFREAEFSVCPPKEGCIERTLEANKCGPRVDSAAAWGSGSSAKCCLCQRVNWRGRFSACPQPLARHEGLPHQTFNEPNYILVFFPHICQHLPSHFLQPGPGTCL